MHIPYSQLKHKELLRRVPNMNEVVVVLVEAKKMNKAQEKRFREIIRKVPKSMKETKKIFWECIKFSNQYPLDYIRILDEENAGIMT